MRINLLPQNRLRPMSLGELINRFVHAAESRRFLREPRTDAFDLRLAGGQLRWGSVLT